MKITHLIASLFIVLCTSAAWFLLGSALSYRSNVSSSEMQAEVAGVWGPDLTQEHPQAWFETPNAPNGRALVMPSKTQAQVDLISEPKQRGLLWHRTYQVTFSGDYTFTNPTKIPQTFYISFPLPKDTAGLQGFKFELGENDSSAQALPASSGVVTRAILLPPSGSILLHTGYQTRGTNTWKYRFPDNRRIAGFELTMRTNFTEINFPVGSGSASRRSQDANGFVLKWDYPEVLAAPAIGMDMPKHLNAGPVASRIAFFAPISLLFFVTIILLISGILGIPLHPMHIFFVAAGFFAFHLLFAYLVDLLQLLPSFAISATCSLLLVCGYLKAVGGNRLFKVALPAQGIYLVLFSASFFIDGLTGITLAILSVITLGLLMFLTAQMDWRIFFEKKPPSLPKPAI